MPAPPPPQPARPEVGRPALAVVVCTVDRADHLARLLPSLVAQAPPGAELLVVDQSDDEEHERARAAAVPPVRLIRLAHRSLPAARNAAIAATTAPVIVFLDDDVVPSAGCLRAHLEAFADPTVGGVVGRIEEARLRPNRRDVGNDLGWDGRIRVRLDGDRDQDIGSLKGANCSFRRRALEQVGGFDEGWLGTALLEDADVSERLVRGGWRLRFVAAAAVVHLHAEAGGVRVGSAQEAERWRFRHTARFLRLHRGRRSVALATPVWVALAASRGWRWRSPGAALRLLGAWVRGASEPRQAGT